MQELCKTHGNFNFFVIPDSCLIMSEMEEPVCEEILLKK